VKEESEGRKEGRAGRLVGREGGKKEVREVRKEGR